MPNCVIDGKTVEFKDGENLVEVAKRAGIEIPVFCYHPGLSVVAQCRMCMIEVEKMPKLQAGCATAAKEGMVVHTKSPRALKNKQAVMEFLLVNHPLDCPICDKSGECDLQDFSYKHGSAYQRHTEDRRTYVDLDMGPVIKKNMNRCIHCTRCIRFGDEIAGIREMVAVKRGNNTEITTLDGRSLETDYASNYADICPTGSLTLKDFRFHKRAWMLKKIPSVCEGCSRGCNLELHQDGNVIYRCVPRTNMEINKYWLCDEGRFNYHYTQDPDRVLEPVADGALTDWKTAIERAKQAISGKKVAILVGSDFTQEEAKAVLEMSSVLGAQSAPLHFGTRGITTAKEDGPEDGILKNKSKTSNLWGVEKLGFKPVTSLKGYDAVWIFRGGRAQLPNLNDVSTVLGFGVFTKEETAKFTTVLPGRAFTEKDGTIFNFEGREQKLKKAVEPVQTTKSVFDFLTLFSKAKSESGAA